MKVSELLAKDIELADLRLKNFQLQAQLQYTKLADALAALVKQAQAEAGAAETDLFNAETREFTSPGPKAA